MSVRLSEFKVVIAVSDRMFLDTGKHLNLMSFSMIKDLNLRISFEGVPANEVGENSWKVVAEILRVGAAVSGEMCLNFKASNANRYNWVS